jgi:hypothetical protein
MNDPELFVNLMFSSMLTVFETNDDNCIAISFDYWLIRLNDAFYINRDD